MQDTIGGSLMRSAHWQPGARQSNKTKPNGVWGHVSLRSCLARRTTGSLDCRKYNAQHKNNYSPPLDADATSRTTRHKINKGSQPGELQKSKKSQQWLRKSRKRYNWKLASKKQADAPHQVVTAKSVAHQIVVSGNLVPTRP